MSSTLGNANYSNEETKKLMLKSLLEVNFILMLSEDFVFQACFYVKAYITKIVSNGEFKTVIMHLINHTEFFIIYL